MKKTNSDKDVCDDIIDTLTASLFELDDDDTIRILSDIESILNILKEHHNLL